jgi:hexosaminidase
MEIATLMKKYNLKMVPLVQTFGHLEFVLKRERFSHLRESKDNYTSICPLNPESIELVCSMISQHMDILSQCESVPFIHIGADEIFNIATCK